MPFLTKRDLTDREILHIRMSLKFAILNDDTIDEDTMVEMNTLDKIMNHSYSVTVYTIRGEVDDKVSCSNDRRVW